MQNKPYSQNVPSPPLRLSLGPVLFFWSKETLLQFYEQVADMPVHTVYLGETVCARRYELRVEDWLALAKDLASAGKEVVLSSQIILESEIDLRRLRKFTEQVDFKIEANDLGAAKLAREHGLPFVAGQTLNIYNEDTLQLYASLGAVRWIASSELSGQKIERIKAQVPHVTCEVFGWGLMPLAFSARCFTARHYNLRKDMCEFKCLAHPDALTLKTQEGVPFLTINGTQTMSAGCQVLLGLLPELARAGVDMLRISPQSEHVAEIVGLHDACLKGEITPDAAMQQLREFAPGVLVDGYWRGAAGAVMAGGGRIYAGT